MRKTGLEVELGAQLHNAPKSSGCDAPEITRVNIRGWAVELGVVEEVEGFDSHLQFGALGERCVLGQREVEVVKSGSTQGVAGEIAELAANSAVGQDATGKGTPGHVGKGRRIKPEVILA